MEPGRRRAPRGHELPTEVARIVKLLLIVIDYKIRALIKNLTKTIIINLVHGPRFFKNSGKIILYF